MPDMVDLTDHFRYRIFGGGRNDVCESIFTDLWRQTRRVLWT